MELRRITERRRKEGRKEGHKMGKCCAKLQLLRAVLMKIKLVWHMTLHSLTKYLPNFDEIGQDLPSPTGTGSSFGNSLPLEMACVVI